MARVAWKPSYRLVHSRFPPVGLFDQVADPADLDAVFAIESLTNDRLRDEVGELVLVPLEDRISGPGTTPIMAAFTHPNPEGSRFSNGDYGVYYAAASLETAIAETAYHRSRFLARTREPPSEYDMRCYQADIDAELVELRRKKNRRPELYHPDNYGPAQAFGRKRRGEGALGIVYDSVRHPGGQCVAIFKPRTVPRCVQTVHVCFVWDGETIASYYVKSGYADVGPAGGTMSAP